MTDVIECHVLGYASETLNSYHSNDPGGSLWSGVRVRLMSGQTRFFPTMAVDAEASLIILGAMDRGEPVELWLSGIDKMSSVYGVKHKNDTHYTDQHFRDFRKLAFKYLAMSLILLPFFGFGLIGLFVTMQMFDAATKFRPKYSREEFNAHSSCGLLAQAA